MCYSEVVKVGVCFSEVVRRLCRWSLPRPGARATAQGSGTPSTCVRASHCLVVTPLDWSVYTL